MFHPQLERALLVVVAVVVAVVVVFPCSICAQNALVPPGALTQRAVTDLKRQARALAEKGDYAQAIKAYDVAVAAAMRAYGAID